MTGTTGAERSRVFISYSRADVEFARQLVDALAVADIQAFLDLESIDAGEDWRERLGALIRSSDSVVFILTQTSAASDICRWEVAEAARLGKRCIPVLPAAFTGDAPEQLASLNYIFFYPHDGMPGSGFGAGLSRLVEALKTDLSWTREHTRLIEQAAGWIARDRRDDQLLRGAALADAQRWRSQAPGDVFVHDSVLHFLAASADAEALRENAAKRQARRIVVGAAALLLLALAALGLAGQQGADAEALRSQQFADTAADLFDEGQHLEAMRAALLGDPAAAGSIWSRLFFWRDDRGPARHALAAALTHNQLSALTPPHDGRAQQVAFSADGRRFATGGGSDGRLRLFERTHLGAVLIDEFQLPGTGISSMALTPDGTTLAATSWVIRDSQVFVWRAGEAEPLAEITADEGEIFTAVSFTPDGTGLIAARHEALDVFDIGADAPRATFQIDLPSVFSSIYLVEASPDGEHVALGVAARGETFPGPGIFIHRLSDGARTTAFEVASEASDLSFDASGHVLAASYLDGRIDLLAPLEGRLVHTFSSNLAQSIALSPEGDRLATGDPAGLIGIFELPPAGEPLQVADQLPTRLETGAGAVLALAFDADGDTLASTHLDGRARLWRLTDPPAEVQRIEVGGAMPPVVSPDGRFVFQSKPFDASDVLGEIYDTQTGERVLTVPETGSRFVYPGDRAAFSLDGSSIALFRPDTIEVWRVDADAQAPQASAALGDVQPQTIAFDADGDTVWIAQAGWTAENPAEIHRWDFIEGAEIAEVAFPPGGISGVALSSHGVAVSWRDDQQGATLYDLEAGAVLAPAISSRDRLAELVFTPDGSRVVTLDRSGFAEVWRVGEPRAEQRLSAGEPLYSIGNWDVAVSPDSTRFASLDAQSVKIWRFGEPVPLQTFSLDPGRFDQVAFGPQGSDTVQVTNDDEIVTLRLDPVLAASPSRQVAAACGVLRAAGASDFLDETAAHHRILQRLQRDPCERARRLPIPGGLEPRPPM
ncbi:MAG: TIR domain-containing protein [Oceanicaulis sp.]